MMEKIYCKKTYVNKDWKKEGKKGKQCMEKYF
jgi:hypothetical protein